MVSFKFFKVYTYHVPSKEKVCLFWQRLAQNPLSLRESTGFAGTKTVKWVSHNVYNLHFVFYQFHRTDSCSLFIKESSAVRVSVAGHPALNNPWSRAVSRNGHLLCFAWGEKIPNFKREVYLPIALCADWIDWTQGRACKWCHCKTTEIIVYH